MNRIFINAGSVQDGEISLDPQARRHALTVLRMNIGDMFTAYDGQGGEYTAKITAADKKEAKAVILSQTTKSNESREINLYLSLIKPQRFEIALEKTAEIGISRIIPLKAARSPVMDISQTREKRWNMILNQAARQSGSGLPPKLEVCMNFEDAAETAAKSGITVLPDVNSEIEWKDIAERISLEKAVNFFIGPEGGFSPEEIKTGLSLNFTRISLGQNILRTETAAIVMAALIKCAKQNKQIQ